MIACWDPNLKLIVLPRMATLLVVRIVENVAKTLHLLLEYPKRPLGRDAVHAGGGLTDSSELGPYIFTRCSEKTTLRKYYSVTSVGKVAISQPNARPQPDWPDDVDLMFPMHSSKLLTADNEHMQRAGNGQEMGMPAPDSSWKRSVRPCHCSRYSCQMRSTTCAGRGSHLHKPKPFRLRPERPMIAQRLRVAQTIETRSA